MPNGGMEGGTDPGGNGWELSGIDDGFDGMKGPELDCGRPS